MMERSLVQLTPAPTFVAEISCLDDVKKCQKHIYKAHFCLFLFFLKEMAFQKINFVL